MRTGNQAWKEIFNSDERKYGGTGNTFNPEPIVTLVDKDKTVMKSMCTCLHWEPYA